MAGTLYFYVLVCLAAVLLAGGMADFLLWLDGDQTISGWLRKHPLLFWLPATMIYVFLGLLALHLFVLWNQS